MKNSRLVLSQQNHDFIFEARITILQRKRAEYYSGLNQRECDYTYLKKLNTRMLNSNWLHEEERLSYKWMLMEITTPLL